MITTLATDPTPGTYVSVCVDHIGARLATHFDPPHWVSGYVSDSEGYVWPSMFHYRTTDNGDLRIFDGDCPIRTVFLGEVTMIDRAGNVAGHVYVVGDAFDNHVITRCDTATEAWRRALHHTRDMCESGDCD